uniref:Uncharacterized protein n=1 Tax=Tanacetum cinerariifolium TaxID=118510 RepID=A0A6L2MTM5_TANCI|nr:hypothetical protein [Tanacetum cinerariifolium]
MVAAAKLPVLNPGEFKLWKMKIKQYFLMTDYALCEVIVNGDSPPPKRTIDGVEQTYPPTTAREKLAMKNELKARGQGVLSAKSSAVATQQWNSYEIAVGKCSSRGITITSSGNALEHFIPTILP